MLCYSIEYDLKQIMKSIYSIDAMKNNTNFTS